MSLISYVVGIAVAALVLVLVLEMLRRRKLRERHALWWLLAGIFALIVGIFPALLTSAAHALGISVPTNLVFFVSIAVLFLVCLQHSAELTTLEAKTRTLAEDVALQDLRIRALEQTIAAQNRPGPHATS
jgi:hypothetical protein